MTFHREDCIAVFDSGLGGLSVLRHLRRVMPDEHYVYYGDCGNAPYGIRPTQQIRQLTFSAVELLLQRPVKALVVACNTATAAAIAQLREKYPQLIIIGIEPALKLAADRFPGGRIGVMATQVTLREEKFQNLWHRCAADCQVYPIEAPGLVELVESGQQNSSQALALLRQVLEPYAGRLDALVLGCTHFPFAAGTISQILGDTPLLDGGDGTARETRRRLAQAGLLAPDGQTGTTQILCSGDAARSCHLAKKLLEE